MSVIATEITSSVMSFDMRTTLPVQPACSLDTSMTSRQLVFINITVQRHPLISPWWQGAWGQIQIVQNAQVKRECRIKCVGFQHVGTPFQCNWAILCVISVPDTLSFQSAWHCWCCVWCILVNTISPPTRLVLNQWSRQNIWGFWYYIFVFAHYSQFH